MNRRLHLISSNVLLAIAALFVSVANVRAAKVTTPAVEITLPTCDWAAVRHPYFSGTDGVNICPYPMSTS